MAGNAPGPTGGLTNNPVIDFGTLCRQASPPPGPFGGAGSALQAVFIKGPLLVGKARRDPGYNFDGSPAEDMMFADSPAQSASIRTDPVFALSDGTLNAYMKQLMTSLSIGGMETVALEMQERFAKAVGGTYRSAILDKEIEHNDATVTYNSAFRRELKTALKNCNYDLTKIKTIAMSLLSFSSFWDKVSGLGITVHQVWSAKAELANYTLDCKSRWWWGDLIYTFYDHYGLDWPDIVKHGEDRIPQYHTGDFFKAWYILQHYRSAKPFITEMTKTVFVAGPVV